MGVPLIEPAHSAVEAVRDPRLRAPRWQAEPDRRWRTRLALMAVLNVALALFYFTWLLQPQRIGNVVLFALLAVAELFNLTQAAGFWWTVLGARRYRARAWEGLTPTVDVLIPVYGEPTEVVEPTVAAARRLHGADVRVHVLDDGQDGAMRALAQHHDVGYITRERHTGAKAGNINHALSCTSGAYVLVLDCDHVPEPNFLTATLGHLQDERVAFVQTPQYYANERDGGIAAAAWAQQALFFGAIARGKDGKEAMFCAGTNVLFSREALEAAGGFPEDSLTEDFALSIRLHEMGWQSRYVPKVLAKGLGPEDMASYVSQQQRWARGCLGGIPAALRSRLPWRVRAQYLLASMYFLSGWTVLAYMSFPIIRILTGAQPLAGTSADQFLLHFAPYFCAALSTVAIAGAGAYTWRAFALASASFWIHVRASVLALLRRRGRFVVTPKQGAHAPQPRTVWPALVMLAALIGVACFGLARRRDPAMLNNVAFALLHVIVLATGVWPALVGSVTAMPVTVAARRSLIRGRRLAAVGVSALLIVAVAGGLIVGSRTRPATHAPPSLTALADQDGRAFLARYERPDGQVIRVDQGGDTVSEGQAYAMLISVALADRERFDAAWSWTRRHLQRPDGLLASRMVGGTIVDHQPATDADLDAARALAVAATRWGDPAYAHAARTIGRAVIAHETIHAGGSRLLVAGPWARRNQIVNPSYFSPGDLQALRAIDTRDAATWSALAAGGRQALAILLRGGHLPPDWAQADAGGAPRPIGNPGQTSASPVYSFDAVRVPIRYAESCTSGDRRLAASLWPVLHRAGTLPAFELALNGAPRVTGSHPAAVVAAAAAARAAGDQRDAAKLLARASGLARTSRSYYGAAWTALGRIMLTTDWLGAPCSPGP